MSESAAARSLKSCPHCKTVYPGGEMFCPLDGTRLSSPSMAEQGPTTDPLLGVIVSGRYKILRRIGEGGMGIVYEAEHVVIEKRVALKVLREDFSRRPELVERFRQEARSASRIGHENIVDISDFGETPSGANYFVMEMLNGEDLAMLLAREGSLNPEFAVSVVLQCCKGLGAAHAKGIVHRDMKPENIFLIEREGRCDVVKLVDFGIAKMSDVETPGAPGRKLTKTGMIFGTPEYMSPEQASGKSLDHRVDIYALGVILYELLSGRVPFVGDTFMGVLTQHMFEDPPKLREINPNAIVPAALESVVVKALAKEAKPTLSNHARDGRRYPICDGHGAVHCGG
jgi:serine/threonine protein kinase